VTKEAALAIHDILLEEHGGRPGLRNRSLLAAALDAPRNPTPNERASVFRLAAVYAHGLCQNHPFVDGNKRVAFTVAITFLELNGWRLEAPEHEAYAVMDALSAGSLGRDEFGVWLKKTSKRLTRSD
jgi:death-on-curing protein